MFNLEKQYVVDEYNKFVNNFIEFKMYEGETNL